MPSPPVVAAVNDAMETGPRSALSVGFGAGVNASASSATIMQEPPEACTGDAGEGVLYYLRCAIASWGTELTEDLRRYEAGGNTKLQLVCTVIICVLVACHVEFYRLARHWYEEEMEKRKRQQQQQRRSKRGKLEQPTIPEVDLPDLPLGKPVLVTSPHEGQRYYYFFTPPPSPTPDKNSLPLLSLEGGISKLCKDLHLPLLNDLSLKTALKVPNASSLDAGVSSSNDGPPKKRTHKNKERVVDMTDLPLGKPVLVTSPHEGQRYYYFFTPPPSPTSGSNSLPLLSESERSPQLSEDLHLPSLDDISPKNEQQLPNESSLRVNSPTDPPASDTPRKKKSVQFSPIQHSDGSDHDATTTPALTPVSDGNTSFQETNSISVPPTAHGNNIESSVTHHDPPGDGPQHEDLNGFPSDTYRSKPDPPDTDRSYEHVQQDHNQHQSGEEPSADQGGEEPSTELSTPPDSECPSPPPKQPFECPPSPPPEQPIECPPSPPPEQPIESSSKSNRQLRARENFKQDVQQEEKPARVSFGNIHDQENSQTNIVEDFFRKENQLQEKRRTSGHESAQEAQAASENNLDESSHTQTMANKSAAVKNGHQSAPLTPTKIDAQESSLPDQGMDNTMGDGSYDTSHGDSSSATQSAGEMPSLAPMLGNESSMSVSGKEEEEHGDHDDENDSTDAGHNKQGEYDDSSMIDHRRSRLSMADDSENDATIDGLEQIAFALKEGLTYENIKSRIKKKTYRNCFSGSAAVDFLSQHLQKPRAEALQIGRRIAKRYNLFIKCGSSKKKKRTKQLQRQLQAIEESSMFDQSAAKETPEDEEERLKSTFLHDNRHIYYRLFAFLPSEIDNMPMVRKMQVFEEEVRVKNHRRGVKTYKKCFRGKDAVNFLVRSRLAATRAEGVNLCNRFIAEYNLFEPVNRMDIFRDSGRYLYRFIDKKTRYFSIDNDFSTRLVELQGNDFDWGSDTDNLGDDDNFDFMNSIRSEAMASKSLGDMIDFESDDSESDSGSEVEEAAEEVHELRSKDYQYLCEVADVLERGIKLRKGGTFTASRAVTFMVTSGLAESRQEAEVLGRRLEREFNLFHEVTGKHDFGDSNHSFRFTDRHERHTSPLKVQLPLDELAKAFEQGVKVKDYTHNLKTHKRTFVGVKAVDFLVNSRLAPNRVAAVRIGLQLVDQYNLFERVTGNREFCDDYVYFRFTPPEARKTPVFEELQVKKEKKPKQASSSALVPAETEGQELVELAQWFLEGVKVKDNKFRAQSYRNTFVGSEAVSFLANNSRAFSRKDAVELGRCLSTKIGLFKGIDGSTDFKDDYLLYRFEERFLDSVSEDGPSLRRGMVSGLEGISGVSAKSLPLEKIAEAFRNNMEVSDHKGRRKTHVDTFVGRDAVDFFVGHGLAEDRVAAVNLGRALAREFDLFDHVKKEHQFKDAKHLYRFCHEKGEIRPLETIELDKRRLTEIAKALLTNVKVGENRKKLLVFNNTFRGSEAVDFLVDSEIASSRREAVQMGRAVTREFNLFDHVTNARKFEDSEALFYVQKEEHRYKGLMFEKQVAQRNIFSNIDDYSLGAGSSASFNLEDMSPLEIGEEDAEWASKMDLFEQKIRKALQPHYMKITDSDDAAEADRKRSVNRFMTWVSKFRRLDPRYQIQYFFHFVAQDGAKNVESKGFAIDDFRPILNFLPNQAQVFSVWRPTSLHAIRKMMCGEGVGKGLDIKGKSAKRGTLSGFVPFLQIGENKHKSKIRPPSKDGVVRLFYPTESRTARDIAADTLERVAQEMIDTVEKAKKVLTDKDASKEAQKDALDAMLLDMLDPKIVYIDSYAPDRYGLEIPERLFWEAYFTRQDCSREQGSEYDTGRPSQPAFQDMNFATLRAQPKEGAPRACVYQHASSADPMNPFELLMAYEEHGRVMPVVSDFDCFLVGTDRVTFTSPLAQNQLKVLSWYVTQLQSLLNESKAGDSWTVRWLEILKKAAREGYYPEMPQFGFGDPKSYSIMKSAVSRLSHSGAVRHGAECFNYYFPQDLDDEFLVIADDLPGNKPWVYVNEAGLTEILSKKVDQGFTFPLNPKWVLCDSNKWYDLYQKLLMSDNPETQQSMNIWFPPESGLREQIEAIHQSRPEGFYKEPEKAYDEASAHGSSSVGPGSKTGKKPKKSKDHLVSMFAMGLLDDSKTARSIDSVRAEHNLMDDSLLSDIEREQKKKKGLKRKVMKKVKKTFRGSKDKSSSSSLRTSSKSDPGLGLSAVDESLEEDF